MKALLLKDWYVLRKQAWAYLIIVLVWGAIPSEVLNLLAVVYGAMIPIPPWPMTSGAAGTGLPGCSPIRTGLWCSAGMRSAGSPFDWYRRCNALSGDCFLPACSDRSRSRPLPRSDLHGAVCGNDSAEHQRPLTLRFGSEKARMVSVLITFLVFASVGFLKGLDAGSPAGAAAFPALLLPAR